MKQILLTFVLLATASCSALRPARTYPHSPGEIADNPSILIDGSIPREEMSLRGVKLGDPKSAIKSSRILKTSDGGWIVCTDGARYQINDDAVAVLGVWDRNILDKLNLKNPAEIESRFGKPESTDDLDYIVIYRYQKGKITVLWNKHEQQVNAVNVSK